MGINGLDEKVFTTASGLGKCGGGNFGRWLRRQAELELADQELEFRFGVGISGEQDLAPVGGRQMDIDHLDGGELFESGSAALLKSRAHPTSASRAPPSSPTAMRRTPASPTTTVSIPG